MRILMASDLYYPYLLGGGERRMYEIARRLAKKHEVFMITRRLGKSSRYEISENVHIYRVFVPSKKVKLESFMDGSMFMSGAILTEMELGDFDVYAPQQFFPIPPSWLVAKFKQKPIIVTIHDVYRETWLQKYGLKGILMSTFEKIMLKLPYTKVVTVSDSSKQKLAECGIPQNLIEVIPNGVNLKDYDAIKMKKTEKPQVIYVGRLVKYKHIDDLLIAFSKLDLNAKLFIVGEGPERKRLEKLASLLGIKSNVVFTGFVREEEKIKLLRSSWVLVLPSSTEGFGITVIEAWAARTPVIVSNIPALKELVGGGGGLIFKLRAIQDLKEKLTHLLENENLREKLSKEGYNMVKEKYNWDRIAKMCEILFQNVVNSRTKS